ncbi:hypothetical protein GA0070620_3832 [Micromonospora krabiensis]|uniref:Uncharacterized protein n=1 Tax=Micromonospora krabiensis TaxID=307121 RepID=A0A1C3N6R6_9ACTN|nr:hypothetical protein GA0070620_3832 [Micromonospora krabiensis]
MEGACDPGPDSAGMGDWAIIQRRAGAARVTGDAKDDDLMARVLAPPGLMRTSGRQVVPGVTVPD